MGYSLTRAFDLWCAWKDHHQMPKAGGYEDQPRKWQQMIHLMNRYFNVAYEQAKAEHVPPSGRDGRDEDPLEDYIGQGAPFVDGTRPSWEQFAQG